MSQTSILRPTFKLKLYEMQPKTHNDMFKVIIFMANNNKLYFDNVCFLNCDGGSNSNRPS